MQPMTDDELIGYCDLHSETPRALFSGMQINRMIELAGRPKSFVSSVPVFTWLSLHEEMKELVKLARERQNKEAKKPPCQIIQFPSPVR